MQDAILILDHDAALAGLIARTLRSQQIFCEPVPFGVTLAKVQALAPRGLIIAARHDMDVSLADFDLALLNAGYPILALGAMVPALCEHFGGSVLHRDYESESVTLSLAELPLFDSMGGGERVLHDLRDLSLPEGLHCLATATERCIGFDREADQLFAVQYPIERNDPDAVQLLRNFACLVCGMEPVWTEDYIISKAVEHLQQQAGDGRVLCAVSGGVDSAVCAKLARLAVGDRLMCVFVDTGLFRKDEPQTVIKTYMETLGLVVAYAGEQDVFLKALRGASNETDKECITAALLQKVLCKQLAFDPGAHTLVLGTNYNDTLYGGYTPLALPDTAEGTPVHIAEPLRGLFKDEIRRVARALALPGTLAERQPFPSSGLALRVYGEVTQPKLDMLREADSFFSEEIRATGHERRLWQYYATLCDNPDQNGGYEINLRACQACSGEACASRLPYDLLERVVARILKELPRVTRVVYDLTPSQQYALME